MKLILSLKKAIISSRAGVFLDEKVRLLLSVVPFLHSKIYSKCLRTPTPDSFVLFLYGGIGDVLLLFPLIQKLSELGRVTAFCESKIRCLDFLLSQNVNLVEYDKNTLLYSNKKLRRHIVGSRPLFVQTSPIFEMYVVKHLLGIKHTIGLISRFNNIRSIGFHSEPIYLDTQSRVEIYEEIYHFIIRSLQIDKKASMNPPIHTIASGNLGIVDGIVIPRRYIVLSAMKTSEWQMGKMPEIEYAKLADYLSSSCGCHIVFVGDGDERPLVDAIIKLCSEREQMINIAGQTRLQDLPGVLSNAEFVVSNDNGISHLSSFLKAKTLVLFMFSDYRVYRWNHSNYDYLFNKASDCMPCVGKSAYPKDNYPVMCQNKLVCNYSITHQDVIKKIESLNWCRK